jgi:hypothetical protein
MTGGLMQLVAYGAQDLYLTGNPLITYFKTVYRRHTNFAVESIVQSFNSTVGFGNKVNSIITRNGDLMMGAYIHATLPDLLEKSHSAAPQYRYTRWIDNIGHYLIKEVSIEIGGRVIDTHYSDWFEIWCQLTVPASQMPGYLKMIGQDPLNHLGQATGLQKDVFASAHDPLFASVHTAPYKSTNTSLIGRDIYIPLQFWFSRNVGLSLPLVALQYHEVKVNIEFRPIHQLVMLNIGDQTEKGLPKVTNWSNSSSDHSTNVQESAALDASLWIDYVFLDSDERRRFAQVSHEYLIEQIQFTDQLITTSTTATTYTDATVDLFFNHPVKELVWVVKSHEATKEYCNFTDTQMPLVPPFANIGYTASTTSNVLGMPGLPLGYIDSSTLAVTAAITAASSALTMTFASGTSGGVTLTVTGATTMLQAGDVILLYDEDNDQSVHLTYTSAGSVKIPAIAYNLSTGTQTFTFESIFRPASALTLDSTNTIATATTASSFAAVTTWDHLNRLTNYNMVRPVNRFNPAKNTIQSAQIKLNSRERFEARPGEYFNWAQCKNHHTNIPKSPGINVYSFAIHPEEHQPSGTCNFSRLDKAQLVLKVRPLYYGATGTGTSTDGTIQTTSKTVTVGVYAVNYNILRIMSGMGGLAYTS